MLTEMIIIKSNSSSYTWQWNHVIQFLFSHLVPWDYRAAELGSPFNLTCKFIDFFARHGVIYDRREATANMVSNNAISR